MTDVPGKSFIILAINRKLFFAGLSLNTDCFFGLAPNLKLTFQPETVIALQNIIRISCKITFRETEIVDGIQQVRFPYPIAPRNAHDSFCKGNRAIHVILELCH